MAEPGQRVLASGEHRLSRRRVLGLSAALGTSGLAGLGGLSGCGAGSKVAGATTACDVDAPADATTVQVLAYSAPALDPFSQAMSDGCSTVQNLRVEHGQIDFAAQLEKARLSLSQQGSGSYDIIEVYGGTLAQYAESGWLAPLDDFVSKEGSRYQIGGIGQTFLDAFTVRGKLYALPMVANVHLMVYRKDILDSLSLEVPTTFEELIAVAKKIETDGAVAHPLALTYGAQSAIGAVFTNSLNSLGGSWLSSAGDRPALTTDVAHGAVTALRSLLPYTDPARLTWDQPEVQSALLNGRAAIGILYSGRAAQFEDASKTDFAGRFGYAVPPAVRSGGKPWATLNVDGFAVAENSSVPTELLAQIAATGTGPAAAKAAGPLVYPVRDSVLGDTDLAGRAPYWPAATATLKAGADPYPKKRFFAAMQTAVDPFLAAAVGGTTTVETALQRAQSAAEKIVARGS